MTYCVSEFYFRHSGPVKVESKLVGLYFNLLGRYFLWPQWGNTWENVIVSIVQNDETFRQRQRRLMRWRVEYYWSAVAMEQVMWEWVSGDRLERTAARYVTEYLYQAWPVTAQTCLYQHNTSRRYFIYLSHIGCQLAPPIQDLFWHLSLPANDFFVVTCFPLKIKWDFNAGFKLYLCCIASESSMFSLTSKYNEFCLLFVLYWAIQMRIMLRSRFGTIKWEPTLVPIILFKFFFF